MSKLQRMFDFQKIGESKKLQSVIDQTMQRYPVMEELDEAELEMVSAGKLIPHKEKKSGE